MTRQLLALLLLTSLGVAAAACSDDTYIATNEPVGSGGVSTGGAQAGGTSGVSGQGFGGTAGSTAGAGGAAGSAGAGGAAGTPNTGGSGGGTCTPGAKEDLGTCQKCGTSRRTCDANGKWGSPVCEDQGACNPGDKTTSGCSDPCAEKTCGASCSFGSCGKKSGATCLYENGTNFQCCGTDHWQFCNSATCDWFACQACQAGSSCLSAC